MANTVEVSVNGVSYKISSEHNFLVGFTHYYVKFLKADGSLSYERTQHAIVVYSGNLPIVYTAESDGKVVTHETSYRSGMFVGSPIQIISRAGHVDPVAFSGFTYQYIGETYEIPYEDYFGNDISVFFAMGVDDAASKMPSVTNQPTIDFGWTDGVGDLNYTDVTLMQGWSVAINFELVANMTGGSVKIEWYRNGTLIQTRTSENCKLTDRLVPSSETLGVFTYQCVVTWYVDSQVFSTHTTDPITVTVIEDDGSGDNTGGDDSGSGGDSGDNSGDSGDSEDSGDTGDPTDPDNPDNPDNSESESTFDLKSWLIGFALGLAGKPMPIIGKKFVGYSLSGHVIPPLPKWDKKTYPYAYISYHLWCFYLRFCSEPLIANSNDYVSFYGLPSYEFNPYSSVNEWVERLMSSNHPVTWTNVDLYNESGTLILSASELVPVYE